MPKKIQNHYCFIVENLINQLVVLNNLVEREIITTFEKDVIMCEKPEYVQNTKLLDILIKKGLESDQNRMNVLLHILENTGNEHLIKKINPKAVFIIDTSQAPDLKDFGEVVKNALTEWYPIVSQLLSSPDYTPPDRVKVTFDATYESSVYSSNGHIVASANYMRQKPSVRSFIHTMVYVIMHYPSSDNMWLTSGIADWVCYYQFEPHHGLQKPDSSKHYRDGYRVMAYFLQFIIEKSGLSTNLITLVNRDCREGKYSDSFWMKHTKRSLDDHWDDLIFSQIQNIDWSSVHVPQQVSLPNPVQSSLSSPLKVPNDVERISPDDNLDSVNEILGFETISKLSSGKDTNDYQTSDEDTSLETFVKSLFNFDDIKMIGQGSFGKVFKVKDKSSRKFFAIKIAKEEDCHRERQNLRKVNHSNMLTYIDSWDEIVNDEIKKMEGYRTWFTGYRTLYCIQTEWCDGGDLGAWIPLDHTEKSLPDTKRICYQITCGVEYLHNHKDQLLHRDLKPNNIFLLHEYQQNSKDLQVKIGDLGLCRATLQCSKGSRAHEMTIKTGNQKYMAPEVSGGKNDYTTAVDIFAISLIFYELIMSATDPHPEFDYRNNRVTSQWFIDTFRNENQYLQRMLSEDAVKRPGAAEVRSFLFKEWQLENL